LPAVFASAFAIAACSFSERRSRLPMTFSLFHEETDLVGDGLIEEVHEIGDLFGAAVPVLGREHERRNMGHPPFEGRQTDRLQIVVPAAMPLERRQAARLRPAPVAVEDEGEMGECHNANEDTACGGKRQK